MQRKCRRGEGREKKQGLGKTYHQNQTTSYSNFLKRLFRTLWRPLALRSSISYSQSHSQTQISCLFSGLHILFSSACNVLLLSTPGKCVKIHLDSVKHCSESMYLLIFSLSSFGTQAMCYSSLIFCCLALQLTHNGHTNIC